MEQHKNQHDTRKDDLRHLSFDLKEHDSYMKAIEMFLEAIQQQTGVPVRSLGNVDFSQYDPEASVTLPLIARAFKEPTGGRPTDMHLYSGKETGEWEMYGLSYQFKSSQRRENILLIEKDQKELIGYYRHVYRKLRYRIEIQWITGKDGSIEEGQIFINKQTFNPRDPDAQTTKEDESFLLRDLRGEQFVSIEGEDVPGYTRPSRTLWERFRSRTRGEKRNPTGKEIGHLLQSAVDYIPGKGQFILTQAGIEMLPDATT